MSVKRDMQRQLFTVNITDVEGRPWVEVRPAAVGQPPQRFSPEELTAMIMRKLKERAEARLGYPVKQVIVICPSYFNDQMRGGMRVATQLAGLKLSGLLREATTAARGYRLDKRPGHGHALVYDLGGSTFDVTVVDWDRGVISHLSSKQNMHLGGADFTQRIIDHFLGKIKADHDTDIKSNLHALDQLRRLSESAKRALSNETFTHIDLPGILPGGANFSATLTRAEFESLTSDLVLRTIELIPSVVRDVGLKLINIDEVLLVGGASRMPHVRRAIKEFFNGKEPLSGIEPDEAIALGVGIQAGIRSGECPRFPFDSSRLPLSFGVSIGKGDGDGEMISMNLTDRGSYCSAMATRMVNLTRDGSRSARVRVYAGNQTHPDRYWPLGHFNRNLAPAPNGTQHPFEITFALNTYGNLDVSVNDLATDAGSTFSFYPEMIEHARREAEDEQLNQAAEGRNFLELRKLASGDLLHGDLHGDL